MDIDILANDTGIPTDGTLTVTDPASGTVVVNDNGTPDDITDDSVTYTPTTGFEGTDTFEYTVCDIFGNCDTATVSVQVGPISPINAVDDTAETDVDTAVDIDILANDTGIPSDGTLTVTDPASGTVVVNDNGTPDDITDDSVTYTPTTGFEGTDTFEYTVCDAFDNCSSATVTINVEKELLEINQLVTPNNDGRNDFLFIRGIENARNNSLKIFNRWGIAVYEGFNYNNQNNVFDGRSKGRSTISVDDYLPAGVYFYIFEYQKEQESITKNGYIYISK